MRQLIQHFQQRRIQQFLFALLIIDGVFIAVHLLYRFTALFTDPVFAISQDRGYAEFFQYFKFTGVIFMLVLMLWRLRAPIYAGWTAVFFFFLLDDSLTIHELGGRYLAARFNLPEILGARGQDFGEFLIFAGAGAIFLILLLFFYPRSLQRDREVSNYLAFFVLLMAFFGVGLDLLQHAVGNGILSRPFGLLEDSGEHFVLSLITAFMLAKTTTIWRAAKKTAVPDVQNSAAPKRVGQ